MLWGTVLWMFDYLETTTTTLNVLQLNQRRSVLHLTLEDTLWYVLNTCCMPKHAHYVTKKKKKRKKEKK